MVLAIILGGLGVILLSGLKNVPNDPPHVALMTFFGQRLRRIKREGTRFFLLHPWVYNGILVDVSKKNQDLPPINVRTPDRAELNIIVSLTWTPDTDHPANLINYLNSGREEGVKNILQDIVAEKMRQWAADEDKEPKTWLKAIKMQDDAMAVIVAAITGRPIDDAGLNAIVRSLRTGNGIVSVPSLGIILNRVNVEKIEVLGALAKAAELAAKEDQEAAGEKVELDAVTKRIKEMVKDLTITPELAREIMQVERGKVKKSIQEIQGNFSPETRAALEGFLRIIFGRKE